MTILLSIFHTCWSYYPPFFTPAGHLFHTSTMLPSIFHTSHKLVSHVIAAHNRPSLFTESGEARGILCKTMDTGSISSENPLNGRIVKEIGRTNLLPCVVNNRISAGQTFCCRHAQHASKTETAQCVFCQPDLRNISSSDIVGNRVSGFLVHRRLTPCMAVDQLAVLHVAGTALTSNYHRIQATSSMPPGGSFTYIILRNPSDLRIITSFICVNDPQQACYYYYQYYSV